MFVSESDVWPLGKERAVEAVRISSTGMTSWRRWRVDLRASVSGDWGAGRVDWWSCLASMRERRLEERKVVGAFVAHVEGSLGKLLVRVFDLCWALIAPALRSERRSWPLARRGPVFEREAHGVMGARARAAMKVLGSRIGMWVEVKKDHCRKRFFENWAFRFSSSRRRLWFP